MKRLLCLWLSLSLLLCAAVLPVGALQAAEAEHPCSLTLRYDQGGVGYGDLEIRIFRVAEFFEDGTYALTGPFAGYPVKIHGITAQQEWQDAARTLGSYAQADGIQETAAARTDPAGTALFENLQTGLYLVMEAEAETPEGRFHFGSFLIFLPTPDDSGAPDYDVEAQPKPGPVTPISRYKIVKLWKDDPQGRPAGVTVEILRDGEHYDTVTLNSENNWSHSWETTDGDSRWTVAEREVPAGYTVAVELKGDTFFVTNTRPGTPEEPPQTGDPAQLFFWCGMMLVSGVSMAALRRRKSR